MNFKFHMPVRAYFGPGCVAENSGELASFGKRALIVAGGRSARESGALQDICAALDGQKIGYSIFDKVENNPSLNTVKAGGNEAKRSRADFVIGIGGGSPLDASKAIAVLAVNDMEAGGLFANIFKNTPLPIIAIPTTAGTGSEVTPYSVLTRDDLQTKASFGNADTFPRIAFLDPHYTESLPREVTVNTAVDALSHCIEGYISKLSTPVSDILAQEGIRKFGLCLKNLIKDNIRYEDRENLLYASMLGGMVISHTSTTIVHGAGYNLTYFKGIPHGKANGYLLAEYLRYNYEFAKAKIDHIIDLMQLGSIGDFSAAMESLIGKAPVLTGEEIEVYAAKTMAQRSTARNIRPVTEADVKDLLKKI